MCETVVAWKTEGPQAYACYICQMADFAAFIASNEMTQFAAHFDVLKNM